MDETESARHFQAQLPYLRPLLPPPAEQEAFAEKVRQANERIAAMVADGWTYDNARRHIIGLPPLSE